MDHCSGSHAASDPLLRIPNRPQDAVVLLVRPVLQCHYSLMCPLACVNTVYINILMSSFYVVPWCAQLACGQNLSSRMPLNFQPERAPSGLCKYCYIYILMPSFHVAPWCAQLAFGQSLSNRMLLSFEPERTPAGLRKYCLYQYTRVLLSCCTLVCPIGMWAKPEQSNALHL